MSQTVLHVSFSKESAIFALATLQIFIENQLKFDRETARIAAFKMWENSAGGPPVFMS